MAYCGRCGNQIPGDRAESCWFCQVGLCYDCWDEFGHCGHPEADEANRRAREVGSEKAYNELLEKGEMTPFGKVIAIACDLRLRQ